MERKRMKLWGIALVLVLALMCSDGSKGADTSLDLTMKLQSAPNSALNDKQGSEFRDLLPFLPCLPAISLVLPAAPDDDCCSIVLARGLTRLCSIYLRFRSRIPDNVVDITRITELPRDCGVPIPRGYTCGGLTVPTTSRFSRRASRNSEPRAIPDNKPDG